MRSAETSGVGVRGFGPSDRRHAPLGVLAQRLSAPVRQAVADISPVTLAVGLTAIIAATLSVVADAARTADEAQSRLQLLAQMATAEPVADWQYSGTVMTTLAGPADGEDAFVGVLHRGLGAFGLALVFTCFAFRRRGSVKAADPDSERHDDLLATIPFGVACWTADGRLIVCNEQYKARLPIDGPDLKPGASYHASVSRLMQGGYMKLISEDDSSRLLELHREDGSCLMIDERPLGGGGCF